MSDVFSDSGLDAGILVIANLNRISARKEMAI